MKKLLAVFLSVLMLTVCVPLGTVSVSAATYGDLTYTVSGGEVTITECGSSTFDALTIPDTIEGYPVTTIGRGAFDSCYSLTSVTIPNSVTSIEFGAFYFCPSLTSVTIGDSVATIGDYAFGNCASLTFIDVGENNPNYCDIDGVLFNKSKTTLVQYPGGRPGAYTIPDSVTTIEKTAFYACYSLTSVVIPGSITTIVERAFDACSSLTSVTILDGVTTIGEEAFWYCSSLSSVNIGNSVTTIGGGAFVCCTSLTSVTIPNSVTTIGAGAFTYCTSLTSVTIGDSVTTIGDYAFDYCSSLTSIDVDENNPNYYDIDGVLFNKNKTTLIYYPGGRPGAYTIPDSVTTIGEDAFSNCDSLTSVTIGDSVTTIGDYAFYDCDSLTSVTIGDSVTTIGEYAFYDCDSLTSVTIGDNVTTIKYGAFDSCYSLTSVTIGNSVTTIEYSAFYGCGSLTDVYYNGTEADRAKITIDSTNDELLNATWHYIDIPAYPGDANGDGKVNNQDLGLLQQYLNEREVEIAVNRMDVDGNGRINNMDLGLLQRYLNGWDVTLSPIRPAVKLPVTPHDVDGKGRIFVESVTLDGNTVTVLFTNRHKKWISDENAYLKYICTDAAGNVLTTGDKHYGFLRFGMLEVGASREMTFTLPEGTAKVEFGDAYIDYWTQWA